MHFNERMEVIKLQNTDSLEDNRMTLQPMHTALLTTKRNLSSPYLAFSIMQSHQGHRSLKEQAPDKTTKTTHFNKLLKIN